MKAEILKHKVMLYYGDYFMSIWNSGDIHCIKEENGKLKDSNFNVKDKFIFDKMFQNFVKHDYMVI